MFQSAKGIASVPYPTNFTQDRRVSDEGDCSGCSECGFDMFDLLQQQIARGLSKLYKQQQQVMEQLHNQQAQHHEEVMLELKRIKRSVRARNKYHQPVVRRIQKPVKSNPTSHTVTNVEVRQDRLSSSTVPHCDPGMHEAVPQFNINENEIRQDRFHRWNSTICEDHDDLGQSDDQPLVLFELGEECRQVLKNVYDQIQQTRLAIDEYCDRMSLDQCSEDQYGHLEQPASDSIARDAHVHDYETTSDKEPEDKGQPTPLQESFDLFSPSFSRKFADSITKTLLSIVQFPYHQFRPSPEYSFTNENDDKESCLDGETSEDERQSEVLDDSGVNLSEMEHTAGNKTAGVVSPNEDGNRSGHFSYKYYDEEDGVDELGQVLSSLN